MVIDAEDGVFRRAELLDILDKRSEHRSSDVTYMVHGRRAAVRALAKKWKTAIPNMWLKMRMQYKLNIWERLFGAENVIPE
ncbi:MAG: hypothetical protein HC888_03725 [Candidatus Competibacteraceae bacterium]|nr:hypothetical protein [Candidatus Competibacteraceae bacterium]